MTTHVAMHIVINMKSEQATIIFQIASVYVDCTLAYQLKAEAFGSEVDAFGSKADASFRS